MANTIFRPRCLEHSLRDTNIHFPFYVWQLPSPAFRALCTLNWKSIWPRKDFPLDNMMLQIQCTYSVVQTAWTARLPALLLILSGILVCCLTRICHLLLKSDRSAKVALCNCPTSDAFYNDFLMMASKLSQLFTNFCTLEIVFSSITLSVTIHAHDTRHGKLNSTVLKVPFVSSVCLNFDGPAIWNDIPKHAPYSLHWLILTATQSIYLCQSIPTLNYKLSNASVVYNLAWLRATSSCTLITHWTPPGVEIKHYRSTRLD